MEGFVFSGSSKMDRFDAIALRVAAKERPATMFESIFLGK